MGLDSAVIPVHVLEKMSPEARRQYGQLLPAESAKKHAFKLEKELQASFENYLRLRGLEFDRPPMHRRSQCEVGRADYIVWRGPLIALVELKADQTRITQAQKDFAQRQIASGTPYLLTRDLGEAIAFINQTLLSQWTNPQIVMSTDSSGSATTLPPAAVPTGSTAPKVDPVSIS